MKKQSTCWALSIVLALLTWLPRSQAAEPVRYRDLNHHEFLKRWLVLSPLPVEADATSEPSEAVQKKAFATDLLAEAGGESGIRPGEGTVVKCGGKEHRWKIVASFHGTGLA